MVVADADIVTLVGCGASHPHAVIHTRADAIRADVPHGVGVPIVAGRGRGVGLGWIRARTRRVVVADADIVTLVGCGASRPHAVIHTRADTIRADVAGSVGVSVVAGRPVGLLWIRARARRVVADADIVALVKYGTGFGIAPSANAGLTGIRLRAPIPVIARRAVVRDWIRALARARVACSRCVALVAG